MTACLQNGSLICSNKLRQTTRLATGLDTTGVLNEAVMHQSYNVIKQFCYLAQSQGLKAYAYATSAVRDAANKNAFLAMLGSLNLTVNVLSGEQEGRFAHLAACKGCGSLIDIGGGSSQLVTVDRSTSFPMGCVRAKELAKSDDYYTARQRLFARLDSIYSIDYSMEAPTVGVGGTITTLGALIQGKSDYSEVCFEGFSFNAHQLRQLLIDLSAMGEQRQSHPMLKKRHDVIISGGLIALYLMERFNISSIHPSDTDGMEGFARYILQREDSNE